MKSTLCPNLFPTRPSSRRIAVVGDAPGTAEMSWVTCGKCHHAFSATYTDNRGTRQSWTRCERCGHPTLDSHPTPLVGPGGRLLSKLLDEVGLQRDTLFIGNVCQVQPPRGEIKYLRWTGPEMQEGVAALTRDLQTFDPQFILALGHTPLRIFRGGTDTGGLDDLRGSVWHARAIVPGVKCLATYHPTHLLRESGLTGIVRFDMGKAARESKLDCIETPCREIIVMLPDLGWTCERVCATLHGYRIARKPTAFDIEGYVSGVSCYSVASDTRRAHVIPFVTISGESIWSEHDETLIWQATRDLLEDPLVPKVGQNLLYDNFVLAWTYGIAVRGVVDDTMLGHWELFPEFPKSLGFQTTLYTDEPFYKAERKSKDDMVAFTYCGKDSCVTLECNYAIHARLQPRQLDHYRFNMSLLTPLLYMELRGMKFDYEKARRYKKTITRRIYALQDRINREVAVASGRETLREFLVCCGVTDLRRVDNRQVTELDPKIRQHIGSLGAVDTDTKKDRLARLLPFLIDAFCVKRRTVKTEVEETTWQPMRHNGKKWVKEGKRLVFIPNNDELGGNWELWNDEASAPVTKLWLKPITKIVTRNVNTSITTLADVRRFRRDSCRAECRRACAIVARIIRGKASPVLRGELASLLGLSLKIRASGRAKDSEDEETGTLTRGDEKDANWFLYEHLKLPPQYVKEGTRLTDRLASDDEAVTKGWVKTKDRRALWFLTLKRLMTSLKYYEALPDPDKRMRFGLNLVGTPTGRMAAYGSPTGSSKVNPQTVPKKARELYVADDGYMLGQFDLDGSDAWTVAAYCSSLGDDTMLLDQLAKLKPAKILALIYDNGASINALSRDELKVACKKVSGEGWLYFACKRVLHGSNYGMGKTTMASQILTDSYKLTGKPIWLDPATCQGIQDRAFFVRYPGVRRWHEWMARELKSTGELVACNGFRRRFYARKDDHDTVKAALAHMPQVMTTYSINLMLSRMWHDPENRRPDGSLRIEPLLCVHDSVIEQWRLKDTDYARRAIPAWFKNEVEVRGVTFTIPANGGAGPNWLHQGTEKWAKYGGIDL